MVLILDSFFGYAVSLPCPPYSVIPISQPNTNEIQINLRPYLDLSTHPDEKQAETALVAKMEKEKIYLTQGTLLQTEQIGWFRIIYAQEDEVLVEGFRRLFSAIGATKI